jgi:hypothetical protein
VFFAANAKELKWVFDAILDYGFRRPISLFVNHCMCAYFYVGCRLCAVLAVCGR